MFSHDVSSRRSRHYKACIALFDLGALLLFQMLLISDQDITAVLCDPNGLAKFLDLDGMPEVNVTLLSGILCEQDLSDAFLTLSDAFDLQPIHEQVCRSGPFLSRPIVYNE